MKKSAKWSVVAFIVATLFLFTIWWDSPEKEEGSESIRVTEQGTIPVKNGILTVTTAGWMGVPIQPGHKVVGWPLDRSLWLKVRFNRDQQLVYDVAPKGHADDKNIFMPVGATFIEWTVTPGQSREVCEIGLVVEQIQ